MQLNCDQNCENAIEEHHDTPERHSRTVLLVDDDSDFLLQQTVAARSRRIRRRHGRRRVGGRSRCLAEQHPDLAVIDVMMENPDAGFTLCYHIASSDPYDPGDPGDVGQQRDGWTSTWPATNERAWIKADALLAKPIRFEQLRREIDRLLPR